VFFGLKAFVCIEPLEQIIMFNNNTLNSQAAQRDALHALTAHRWEDGHEYIVYLEPDSQGMYCEVAAVPVEKKQSSPTGQKTPLTGAA